MLSGNESEAGRQGAVALVSQLAEQMAEALVPYAFLLVVPIMGLMSDPSRSIRTAATSAFAVMVGLLPLAQVRHGGSLGWKSACLCLRSKSRVLRRKHQLTGCSDHNRGPSLRRTWMRSKRRDGAGTQPSCNSCWTTHR